MEVHNHLLVEEDGHTSFHAIHFHYDFRECSSLQISVAQWSTSSARSILHFHGVMEARGVMCAPQTRWFGLASCLFHQSKEVRASGCVMLVYIYIYIYACN